VGLFNADLFGRPHAKPNYKADNAREAKGQIQPAHAQTSPRTIADTYVLGIP